MRYYVWIVLFLVGSKEPCKFDFDHHLNCIFDHLPEKIDIFAWHVFFGSSRGSFSKNNLSKTDLPFLSPKIGLRNTFFFLAENLSFVLFCLLQLCPILAYFFKNWSSHRAEKHYSLFSLVQSFPPIPPILGLTKKRRYSAVRNDKIKT